MIWYTSKDYYLNVFIQSERILSLYSTANRKALSCPPLVEHINALLDFGSFNDEGKRTCQPLITLFGV